MGESTAQRGELGFIAQQVPGPSLLGTAREHHYLVEVVGQRHHIVHAPVAGQRGIDARLQGSV